MNPVVRNDIEVSHFLDSVGAVGGYDKERRDHLLDILDVDLSWRMHQVIIKLIFTQQVILPRADLGRRETSGSALHGSYGSVGCTSVG
jgi:hypothetical protein